MKKMLSLPPNSFNSLAQHALSEYPHECCGVLLGTRDGQNRRISQAIRCRNAHVSPASHYSIDPAELISIQRNARELQLEIIGFYHSHPDHPPTFSETDLEEANWTGCSYVIIGIDDRQFAGIRSYLLHIDGDRRYFVEEPLSDPATRL
jgi:proteasome lid subunit RPN8/RPN11